MSGSTAVSSAMSSSLIKASCRWPGSGSPSAESRSSRTFSLIRIDSLGWGAGSSPDEEGDLHGDGILGAVDFTGEAVPALVVAHMGFGGQRVHAQAIGGAGIQADAAAGDALCEVDDHRHVERLRGLER